MPTSIIAKAVYVKETEKWSTDETEPINDECEVWQLEVSILSIIGIAAMIAIAVVFTSHTNLDTVVAMMLVYLYSVTSLLLSNEYLLSDMYTKTP
jgi:hypothetical protein